MNEGCGQQENTQCPWIANKHNLHFGKCIQGLIIKGVDSNQCCSYSGWWEVGNELPEDGD